jgi:hypothetical protein
LARLVLGEPSRPVPKPSDGVLSLRPMPRSKTRRGGTRWAGSTSDVARLANTASHILGEATGAEPTCTVTVELPGLDQRYDSTEEFERELTPRDLPQVGAVTVVLKDATESGYEVVVRIAAGTGATLTVGGPDRTVVEGITARLTETVFEGHAAPWVKGWEVAGAWIFLAPMAVLLWFATVGYDQMPEVLRDSDRWFVASLVGVLLVIVALGGLVGWLSPAFELLAPGKATRFNRFRAKWKWLGGVVVVAVVGAVVTRLLN